MKLTDLGSDGLLDLSRADELPGARELLTLIRAERARLERQRKLKPCMDDGDLRRDVRWLLGGEDVVDTILDLPRKAKEFISQQTAKGQRQ
jgi:hypothetical protein